MSTETKAFGIGAILSVTGESMVCDIGDIYKLLGWLTGEELMTHQLPRAARESEGFLRECFPDLAAVEMPAWSEVRGWATMPDDERKAHITAWLNAIAAAVGGARDVPRLPAEDHTSIDPFTELKMMRPDLPVIAVELP